MIVNRHSINLTPL